MLWAVLSDPISDDDEVRFILKRGDCRGQALWEALAELVALRTWSPLWQGKRTLLRVRGDSRAALGALGRLRSASPRINAVARELAIDIAEARYELAVHEHVAGKLNVLPDFLSRLCEPGAARVPPADLEGVHWTRVDERNASWWRTWSTPVDVDLKAETLRDF